MKNLLPHCPLEILEKITTSVDDFVKDAEQSDDLTMLAIRYTPKQSENTLTERIFFESPS